ncbi:UNVERIFIED_CONTAM: Thaumatin-like protein 1 [Sesamum calycinum]|uniref:Thaumatin-like protein 1 n=1 Tax=Sesamum calycinum TaxID=2727403 RepID=A0AAW2MMC9_9LAMI
MSRSLTPFGLTGSGLGVDQKWRPEPIISPSCFSFRFSFYHFQEWWFPATFTFVNQCGYTVWPGLLSSAGSPQLSTTGFALNSGDSIPVSAPASWSGRMWGRTVCSQDSVSGRFTCLTGDCGSGTPECGGGGAAPPATLAEFTLNGAGGLDFYDVSLVDGYNLPMLVTPQGGTGGGNCTTTGCVADLNGSCPSELKVVSAVSSSSGGGGCVACRSACEAFGEAKYCVAASMGRRILASRARTLSCSRARARGLTAMLTMTAPAHLPVLPRITSSPSALLLQPDVGKASELLEIWP